MFERLGLKALRQLDPERAHRIALKALAMGLGGSDQRSDPDILSTTVFGKQFSNPIGIAPGFDKHCEALAATLKLGPGFTEIGGVTPLPQYGNPKPRLFRLVEDRAVINRFGFNSEGHAVVSDRLDEARAAGVDGIVGVNLAINKDTSNPAEDYAKGILSFGVSADFVTINISSPNTAGLRDLQGEAALMRLLDRAVEALTSIPEDRRPALLVKVAPDLDDAGVESIADVALSFHAKGLAALVISNTTIARPESLHSLNAEEVGGLSGKPLFAPSTAVLKRFARHIDGRMPLIGAGGIASGADAYAKIKAGASLVQLYSALVYEGPSLIGRIKRELAQLLDRDGYASVSEAVGHDL
ncbi:MAG: quinone-dependent dihydroorotate dehydrogenase [Alphaproteobacteria bacterium]